MNTSLHLLRLGCSIYWIAFYALAISITPEQTLHALQSWRQAAASSKPSYGSFISVDEYLTGTPITAYLQQWLGTKSRVKDALHDGQIQVNQRLVYSNYKLKLNDQIQFLLKDSQEIETTSISKQIERLTTFVNILLKSELNPALSILYEDNEVAVVMKPSGVHSLRWVGTLKKNVFALDDVLPIVLSPPSMNSPSYHESLLRPLPCHRLDSRVPGCLLIGKTVSSLSHLNHQFQNRSIHKEYTAILCGNATDKIGNQSSLISMDVNGCAAESIIQVLDIVGCNVYGAMSKVLLHPLTGRRHQLRQHCAWIGCPIVGDDVYHNCASYPLDLRAEAIRRAENGERVEMFQSANMPFPSVRERGGLFLMSTGIEFTHPVSNARIKVDCQTPRKFGNLLHRAQKGADWAAQHVTSNTL